MSGGHRTPVGVGSLALCHRRLEGYGLKLLQSPHLSSNLEALLSRQAPVARAVETAVIPDDVTETTGRDGCKTFRMMGPDGRMIWLGRSSMPTVSAPAVTRNVNREGGNMVLPGVLTGHEAVGVLSLTAPFRALFVVEPDYLLIKLAFCLHDFAEDIANGRLVFITGEETTRELSRYLQQNPGYEFPGHILTPPQSTPAQIADLQRRIESAAESVAQANTVALANIQRSSNRAMVSGHTGEQQLAGKCRRNARASDLTSTDPVDHGPAETESTEARNLSSRTPSSLPDVPRVAVVSADPNRATLLQAGRISRALRELGWTGCVCVPDQPGHCRTIARLQAINSIEADLVLCLNSSARPLKAHLPPGLPIACWYLPGAVVGRDLAVEPESGDIAFATSRELQDALTRGGADTVEPIGVAGDATLFHPLPAPDKPLQNADGEVAVLADVPRESPEATGITLPSHVTLWHHMCKVMAGCVDSYRDSEADGLLQKAQRASGVTLEEEPIRNHFLGLLRAHVAPAAIARDAIETLAGIGYRASPWGYNWQPPSVGPDLRKGPIPEGEALNRLFNDARVVLFPVSSPVWLQLALDALASGAIVVFRSPDRGFDIEYPGLADLADHLHPYRSRRELADTLRDAIAESTQLRGKPTPGRERVLQSHTVTHRLEGIWSAIRNRRPSGHKAGAEHV